MEKQIKWLLDEAEQAEADGCPVEARQWRDIAARLQELWKQSVLCEYHRKMHVALRARSTRAESVLQEIREELYGQGYQVLGFHLNGDTVPLDSWFEENNWLELLTEPEVSFEISEDLWKSKYITVDITDKVTHFGEAANVAVYLWGRDLAEYAVYRLAPLRSADIAQIQRQLESEERLLSQVATDISEV